MKTEPCEIPVYENKYEQVYKNLLDAHRADKAIRVDLDGMHHGSILMQIRKLHKRSELKASHRVASSLVNGSLILWIAKDLFAKDE